MAAMSGHVSVFHAMNEGASLRGPKDWIMALDIYFYFDNI